MDLKPLTNLHPWDLTPKEAIALQKHLEGKVIFDGQGIAHPRRCGLASHIGLLLDMPAIGCAKTRLSGWNEEPHTEKGSYSYLKDGDETIAPSFGPEVMSSRYLCRSDIG